MTFDFKSANFLVQSNLSVLGVFTRFCSYCLSLADKFLRFVCGVISSVIVLFCLVAVFTAQFGLGTGAAAGVVAIVALMLLIGLAVVFAQLAIWCFTGKNLFSLD